MKMNDIQWHPKYSDYGATRDGKIFSSKSGKPKELSLCTLGHGYLAFTVCHNGKRKTVYAHRFVFECWVGLLPKEQQINHRDGDKTNNARINLEMCFAWENMEHACSNGLCGHAKHLESR